MHRTYLAITAAGTEKFADQVLKSEGPFLCLGCGGKVIARQGSVRAWHYAHAPAAGAAVSSSMNCGESLLHRTAKHLLRAHLSSWRFQLRCCQCDGEVRVHTFGAGKYVGAEEHAFGAFRIDVAVLSVTAAENTANSPPVAAIEVRHTHAVSAEKRLGLGVPIIEVSAAAVVRYWEAGTWECPYRDGHTCQDCLAEAARKLRRPCMDCGVWFNKTSADLHEVGPPFDHSYPRAYLCNACGDSCPTCEDFMPRHKIVTYRRCLTCNKAHCAWKLQASDALATKAYRQLCSAARQAKPWFDPVLRLDVQAAHVKWTDAWTQASRLLLKRSRSLVHVINKRCLRAQQRRAQEAYALQQREAAMVQRRQQELAQEAYALRQRKAARVLARSIENNTVALQLDVLYEDKDEAKAAGAVWNAQQRTWFARSCEACLACVHFWPRRDPHFDAEFKRALSISARPVKVSKTDARPVKVHKSDAAAVTLDTMWDRFVQRKT